MFNCPQSTPAPDNFRFPRSHRLTGKADLTVVLREGKRTRTKFLDVRVIASPLAHPRVGIIVAKRGRTTTDRNRLKRRLRELARLRLLPNLQAVDVVVQARPEAYDATFVELEAQLLGAVEKILRILRDKSPETM